MSCLVNLSYSGRYSEYARAYVENLAIKQTHPLNSISTIFDFKRRNLLEDKTSQEILDLVIQQLGLDPCGQTYHYIVGSEKNVSQKVNAVKEIFEKINKHNLLLKITNHFHQKIAFAYQEHLYRQAEAILEALIGVE